MRLIVACEWSGTVRDAFRKRGHEAWSFDLEPDDSPYHVQDDVLKYLDHGWDMLIGFPPCTYLCSSGLHHNIGNVERQKKTEKAFEFFMHLWDTDIPLTCLENPVGCVSSKFRPPDQYLQPYQFGHDASKKTGLWLRGLPVLSPTRYVPPRLVKGRKRWANQTDGGQNRLGPSPDRGRKRGKTFQGLADAMADQWG